MAELSDDGAHVRGHHTQQQSHQGREGSEEERVERYLAMPGLEVLSELLVLTHTWPE